jgi:hypothetical protein
MKEYETLGEERRDLLEHHRSKVDLGPEQFRELGWQESVLLASLESPVFLSRSFFEFLVPAVIGLIAVTQLFTA